MVASVSSIAIVGAEARSVAVVCVLAPGTTRFTIQGLPDHATEDTRKRVQTALSAMGLSLPPKCITIDLRPPDLPKVGRHYDLPITLALLAGMGLIDTEKLADWIAIGEFAANGRIVSTTGVALAALHAKEAGKGIICPADQEAEARAAGDAPVLAAGNLIALSRQLKRAQPASEPVRGEVQVRQPFWRKVLGLTASAAPSPSTEPEMPQEEEQQRPASVMREARQPFIAEGHEESTSGRSRAPEGRSPARSFDRERREPNPNFHGIGHRERLRDRLLDGGADALADYEVLEFILFGAQRKGDTKPLAKALIKRFGSLPGVLNASPEALMQIPGIGRHSVGVIMVAAAAAKRMARAQIREQPILGTWQTLIDYLTIDMAHLTRERVRVLYLDSKNRLIKDEHISDGTIDEASVHPREVIHHALDSGASALILVHNHPSGSPEPSQADIEITHRIAEAGRLVGIAVHDHVIIGKEGHVSLRAKGLI